jgi:hypothetical protein
MSSATAGESLRKSSWRAATITPPNSTEAGLMSGRSPSSVKYCLRGKERPRPARRRRVEAAEQIEHRLLLRRDPGADHREGSRDLRFVAGLDRQRGVELR